LVAQHFFSALWLFSVPSVRSVVKSFLGCRSKPRFAKAIHPYCA